ncbi:phospholipase D-like domain-containing protein [Thermogemmatispora carboxidivorans]|uniref:phospholipase D-like domain-containing protein n=1 Tax=Thermogemmatispora carboxidivorans TaxID=1382306 RepID=UPI00069AC791|nr:phospholipase D-like domain-containing protein [Thermogemmatispora carboxidivorans]
MSHLQSRSWRWQPVILFSLTLWLLVWPLLLPGPGIIAQAAQPSPLVRPASRPAAATPGPGVKGVQLFVEPQAGEQVILQAIAEAQRSLAVEIYLLTDRSVIQALEEAAKRGLTVRVMLEPHPYGGGSPAGTIRQLRAAGVEARYANPAFPLTHAKLMIVDGARAYIMTGNFSRAALGGNRSVANREYGIVDPWPGDVSNLSALFEADWQRTTSGSAINDAHLVISPGNARAALQGLISEAQRTVFVEEEEMRDQQIEAALVAAERRGVRVQVILPAPRAENDPNAEGIATLLRGGVAVREDGQLYMHAKMLVIDGREAFVGSENCSPSGLESNREVGILVADEEVLATLQTTFRSDWEASQAAS